MGISKLQGLWVTCNPHKFEIPALRFPYKPPVNPCKHLQCTFGSVKEILLTELNEVSYFIQKQVKSALVKEFLFHSTCKARRTQWRRAESGHTCGPKIITAQTTEGMSFSLFSLNFDRNCWW